VLRFDRTVTKTCFSVVRVYRLRLRFLRRQTFREFHQNPQALPDFLVAHGSEHPEQTHRAYPRGIHAAGSPVKILLIPANEELEIALEMLQMVT
jgi:hypothetical protein